MPLQSNRSLATTLFAITFALALWSPTLATDPMRSPAAADTHLVYAAPSAPVLM